MAEPISVGVIAGSLAIKAVSLVSAGFFLAIGFYGGKKLTNQIDYFLYKHSKAYQDELAKMKGNAPLPI